MTTQQTITVPLFVNGEGMSGGKVHYSIEGTVRGIPRRDPQQLHARRAAELELGVLEPDDGTSSLVVLMRPDVVGCGAYRTDITEHGGRRSYRATLGAR